MPKINILPESLACLIAAGEVVERPASVVKELMENSIDAGATKITVEIKNGGVRYIRITDNGCGISREDVPKAFISHATSKIKTSLDLDAIFTLGFRGEALASVAAVAHIEMLTKTADDEIGTRYLISGGKEEGIEDAGCPEGTTIMIRDLFYNTPARMKFLKKDMTEGSHVADVVTKIALSHPDICISLIKDNRRTLFTPGDGRLLSVINEVYGKELGSTLIECEGNAGGISVKGFISKPVHARPNRNMQHCFVNGRYVKLPVCASALDNAYRNQIMTGKYPACVLFLELNPAMVDVNVHPAKTQVRFANEKSVYDAIYFAAVSSLQKKDTPVSITMTPKKTADLFMPKTKVDQVEMPSVPKVSVSFDTGSDDEDEITLIREVPVKKTELPVVSEPEKKITETIVAPVEIKQNEVVFHETKPSFYSTDSDDIVLNMPVKEETEPEKAIAEAEEVIIIPPSEPEKEAEPFRVIGEVFGTYILVQKKNEMLFVDKHAAHERIIYNSLRKQKRTVFSQMLMSPVTVVLSVKEYNAVIDNLDIFEKSGYRVTDFGMGTVRVTECPTELSEEDIPLIISEIADRLCNNSAEPEPEKLDWLYHSTACRAAIKAGDSTTLPEMEHLVDRVLNDDEVRYCPHGRPVMFSMSEYEIKKLFGRNG